MVDTMDLKSVDHRCDCEGSNPSSRTNSDEQRLFNLACALNDILDLMPYERYLAVAIAHRALYENYSAIFNPHHKYREFALGENKENEKWRRKFLLGDNN